MVFRATLFLTGPCTQFDTNCLFCSQSACHQKLKGGWFVLIAGSSLSLQAPFLYVITYIYVIRVLLVTHISKKEGKEELSAEQLASKVRATAGRGRDPQLQRLCLPAALLGSIYACQLLCWDQSMLASSTAGIYQGRDIS